MNTAIPPTSLNNSQKAAQLAPEIKNKLIEISERVSGKLHPQHADIEYLFEIFDEYITPYPPKKMMGCSDCRVMVRNFWEHEIAKW